MQGGIVITADRDMSPLSLKSNEDQERTEFAHNITDRLSEDILERYGLFARMFKTKRLELYVLDENCHMDDDFQAKNECKHSRVHLPHDNANQREIMRDIVAMYLPNVIQTHKLPFGRCDVEVREVEVYATGTDYDRYGKDYALHIILSK